jgi:hypothetical protein
VSTADEIPAAANSDCAAVARALAAVSAGELHTAQTSVGAPTEAGSGRHPEVPASAVTPVIVASAERGRLKIVITRGKLAYQPLPDMATGLALLASGRQNRE